MARRYCIRCYGEVASKKEYMSVLGPAIRLKVAADCGDTKIFDNAAWTLQRFEVGDKVTWPCGGGLWAWLKDPRGTDSLKKVSELEKKTE